MAAVLENPALDQLFREARTRNAWSARPVADDQIRAIYDLFKFGPTAVNSTPARVVWVKSDEAKQRLAPHLTDGNRAKTLKAPVTARALGLDAGPMSGFDNAGVDAEFFAGTNIKSNFIVALGYGTEENLFPRSPRLDFDEANTIL
jgi:3-hydroxypropanoate dehydrogenase